MYFITGSMFFYRYIFIVVLMFMLIYVDFLLMNIGESFKVITRQ